MTKYSLKFDFGTDIEDDEAQAWLEGIQGKLPEGTTASLKAQPLILDLDDLTDEHAGNSVVIRGYYKPISLPEKSVKPKPSDILLTNLVGMLEHVYPTGDHQGRKTLVLDGKAYDIPAYSMVELGEW